MAETALFEKIELHLIRVLHTMITERSASRAAVRLRNTQPAVSAQLKRLRALVGDPLLVRAGTGMAPAAVALQLLEPAVELLRQADRLRGVIDEHLDDLGLARGIAVRSPYFGLVPQMVARSWLVLTTGRLFCTRSMSDTAEGAGLRIVRCPVALPALVYYQLWHDVTHQSATGRWLRGLVREVVRDFAPGPSFMEVAA